MYSHSYSFNTDICLHIHSAECTVRLLNQAGRNNYPYNPKNVGPQDREASVLPLHHLTMYIMYMFIVCHVHV